MVRRSSQLREGGNQDRDLIGLHQRRASLALEEGAQRRCPDCRLGEGRLARPSAARRRRERYAWSARWWAPRIRCTVFGPVGGERDAHLVLDSQLLVDGDGRPRCSRSQLQQPMRDTGHASVLSGQLHRRQTGRTDLHGLRLGLCARPRLLERVPRLGILPGRPTWTLQRRDDDSLLLRARLRQRRRQRPFLRERRLGLSAGLRLLDVLPRPALLSGTPGVAHRRGNAGKPMRRQSKIHLLRGRLHERRDHLAGVRRLGLALPRGSGLAGGLPGPAVLPRRVASPHEASDE
jgi:hypothetical protein